MQDIIRHKHPKHPSPLPDLLYLSPPSTSPSQTPSRSARTRGPFTSFSPPPSLFSLTNQTLEESSLPRHSIDSTHPSTLSGMGDPSTPYPAKMDVTESSAKTAGRWHDNMMRDR
jgi:hypothetical protein